MVIKLIQCQGNAVDLLMTAAGERVHSSQEHRGPEHVAKIGQEQAWYEEEVMLSATRHAALHGLGSCLQMELSRHVGRAGGPTLFDKSAG